MLGQADTLLGTQGWDYQDWMESFYPQGTKPSARLAVYSRAFRTVEVDATAYAVPTDPVVRNWRSRVPAGFVFALKIPQTITHERRLQDTTTLLRRFLDRVSQLDDRLGPLLVQLSPGFRPNDANRTAFREFLGSLSRDFRWAVEFRQPGWLIPATLELLKSRNIALVLAEGRWIRREMMVELAIEPTADFAYLRWLGQDRRLTDYSRVQLDRDDDLKVWADVVATLEQRVSVVYGYFSNNYQGHAPHSVRQLQQLLGQPTVPPEDLREQGELF
ncbi:MAG: DUF72 domain-containing protein [Gemmatimonadales bacterium]